MTHTMIVRRTPSTPLVLHPLRRRDRVLARLLSPRLDARLAGGVLPESTRLLAVRAAQLVDPRHRASLAHAWAGVVARATRPSTRRDARVPVARMSVLSAERDIADLIGALSGAAPVSAREVARARRLLTDGAGPVYVEGLGLRSAVARLAADLASVVTV